MELLRRWPGQVGMGATMAITAAWEGKKIVVGVVESHQAPTTAELWQDPTAPRLRVRRNKM
jgi:K+-sensing histidine kinase KdpD